MTKRSRKTRKVGVLVLLGVVAFAAVAFGVYSLVGRRGGERPRGKVEIKSPPVVTLSEHKRVTIYLPKKTAGGVCLAPKIVATEAEGSKLDVALSALLAVGQKGGEAAGLIPDGTKLRGPVNVKGDVAVVDFSKEFQENFSGGSDQEALTLNAIVHTLVANGGGKVKRAQILIEGEPAETLGGHFELSEPISADSTLLQPQSGR
ncbi:MAG: GerMN domain-containing protein [Armatimonadota bacterium]|nr:GerMN domain-containing protein [Armatimonadota bacterium]